MRGFEYTNASFCQYRRKLLRCMRDNTLVADRFDEYDLLVETKAGSWGLTGCEERLLSKQSKVSNDDS